jgi:endonuclease/exonuclease/phosphatase family metal-dependent hydrolase
MKRRHRRLRMGAETLTGARAVQCVASAATLTVATWNIHGAIGCDGRYAPARIVDVLGEIDADVVALQEVASAQAHSDFLAVLERETGYHVVAGLLRQRHGSDFGNAVLSRFPVRSVERLDLAIDDYEPRGALDVCLDIGLPLPIRVVATHLGLRPGERREQVRRILAVVEREPPHPTLLMGDLNEWYLWGRPLRWLRSHFRAMPVAPRTFPSRRPVFALDRIWVSPGASVRRLANHSSALARIASDHLPLIAEIVVTPRPAIHNETEVP